MSLENSLRVPTIPLARESTVLPPSDKIPSFVLRAESRSYSHQYSNIYYLRLQLLKRFVLARARRRWKEVAGDPPYVERVLEVVKGQLCFIVGTVYMDMPLKPNVLEDIAHDHSLPAPPPRPKYYSSDDQVMLEDESGRVVLVGAPVRSANLVTGVVLAALGAETSGGEFEVIDVCFAGMAPQPSAGLEWRKEDATDVEKEEKMDVDGGTAVEEQDDGEWVALVSGLDVGDPSPADAQLQMLVEYLTGEAGGAEDQARTAEVSRLIIAGNSLSPAISTNGATNEEDKADRKARRYGNDTTSFSPHPTLALSAHLLDLARSMPVHILPGPSDPAGTLLPQQAFPQAMFRGASAYASFSCETNPTYIRMGPSAEASESAQPPATKNGKGKQKADASTSRTRQSPGLPAPTGGPSCTLLVTSGQPVDDMFRYVATPPVTRLSLAASSLRWRHLAPTAPDTLWCHPYFTTDPFVITETPDVYVVGNQPRFATRVVEERGWGPRRRKVNVEDGDGVDEEEIDESPPEGEGEVGMEGEEGVKRCRIVLVPRFRETGTLVLVNLRTLAVRTVQFAVEGMSAGGER
ncbi:uncharacterized protein LAESUDRAFT_755134 [Laetiporus sulphureus 93-53]|uniref:DNA-directed DNA polymerase n=1 Tax=Laetiporus sulphureus 93-53 TaxID=1314785 RepID=A0A165HB44_9APHY|nr:uncharacterized protein LAESUDRAFT_755134 [Laetiporus sulphureus 93-53]KZT11491.1 hypothetical protein LAESUDRAFT_755134 [Laetiporus sulphureus 93-53]